MFHVSIICIALLHFDSINIMISYSFSFSVACSGWTCHPDPDNEFYCCIDCMSNNFGGWPDEMPVKYLKASHRDLLVKECSGKDNPTLPDLPTSRRKMLSKGSRKEKKKNEKTAQQEATDFRDCAGTEKGINLKIRKEMKHSHCDLSMCEDDLPDFDEKSIKNEVIRRMYKAQLKFFKWLRKKGYKDKDGNPLVFNPMSLPLGLAKDADVIALLYNYVTLEEGRPLAAHGRSGFTATHSNDDTLVCSTIEMGRCSLGDEYFFSFILGDVHPIAYPNDSTLAKHLGCNVKASCIMKMWAKQVLAILVETEGVKIGIGATTAHTAFCQLFKFEKIFSFCGNSKFMR